MSYRQLYCSSDGSFTGKQAYRVTYLETSSKWRCRCLKISNKIADLGQGRSCPQLKWICLLEEVVLLLGDWKIFNSVRHRTRCFPRYMCDIHQFASHNQFSQFEMEVSRNHLISNDLGRICESLYFLLCSS